MIHKAKDLSQDQRILIEGLLGHPVAAEEAISIRSVTAMPAPQWLKDSWESARHFDLDRLSMEDIETEIAAVRGHRHR